MIQKELQLIRISSASPGVGEAVSINYLFLSKFRVLDIRSFFSCALHRKLLGCKVNGTEARCIYNFDR
jgi:hypothetical protein